VADLGALRVAEFATAGRGPLSPLARAQYAALVRMRWRMLVIGLKSIQGIMELGATGVSLVVFGMIGMLLTLVLTVEGYSMTSHGEWSSLPALLWIAFVVWQTVPIALATFQEQFDLSGLLRFPVSFASFYVLHMIFGLLDVSTILGGLGCAGIWLGVTIARPQLSGWTALALVVFAVFNLLLARAILALLDRWLEQRKTREILGGVFMVAILSLQLLNPALYQSGHGRGKHGGQESASAQKAADTLRRWEKPVEAVQDWLPPGLGGMAVGSAAEQRPGEALGLVGLMGLYVLGAGGVLGLRLRGEYRGESLGEAPARQSVEHRKSRWQLAGSGPVAAVMEKELQTLFRSMPVLYAIGAPLFMVVVFGALFRSNSSGAGHSFPLAVPLCVAYALLGASQLIYNVLGAEGTAVQVLFLSPTPIRTVLLAKNLFHAIVFSIVALVAGILASVSMGRPKRAVLAATVAWLLFALPANLAAGNILSLVMPHRMNLGRLMRQRRSASSALVSMAIQSSMLGVGAAIFVPCVLLGRVWLAVPILLVLAAGAVYAWVRVLRNVDAMANRHRELLLSTLAKAQ
jgi:ABC-2 type transport system permease protein